MDKKIDVSIIIVSFNTKKLTQETIESVVRKTKGINYEFLVIDNDSKDGSIEMLRKLKRGTRKARLAIFLYKDKPPLMTFARLIWSDRVRSQGIQRHGFVFIDVSPHFYEELIKYVHRHLKSNK